ncbi:MAG: glycosyltransferase family 4 protein [Armatimonadetes bacterium]|nr:glycosyltransferase family 4 protein [Armatimonadota bacterium]
MKILLGHKYFFRGGGTSTYLFALMDYLREHGHEPIPFSVRYAQNEPSEYSDYFMSPPLGPEASHLRDMKLTPLNALRLLARATYSLEARRKVRDLIRDTSPDIAYVHNLYNYMSPSMIDQCKEQGLPVVMRVPDFNLVCAELHLLRDNHVCRECVGHSPLRAIRHRCLKGSRAATAARAVSMWVHNLLGVYHNVDLFITPSMFMRKTLIEAGYHESRIVHLRSFYSGPAAETANGKEQDYILYFGRIAIEKAIDTLLRAFAIANPEVRLVLAGSDVDGITGDLVALAAELGIGDRVEFVGHKGRDELDNLITHCLFTVVPSRWYDNCPMSVLESFAHGKPVIGADIGGIPEQITPECGMLFEADDPDALASCMTAMLGDSELRRSMGRAGRQRLLRLYSPEKHCETLLTILGALVAGKAPGEIAHGIEQAALHTVGE